METCGSLNLLGRERGRSLWGLTLMRKEVFRKIKESAWYNFLVRGRGVNAGSSAAGPKMEEKGGAEDYISLGDFKLVGEGGIPLLFRIQGKRKAGGPLRAWELKLFSAIPDVEKKELGLSDQRAKCCLLDSLR